MSETIAATLIGVVATLAVALFGGAWLLSGRVARVTTLLEEMPGRIKGAVRDGIREHERDCASYDHVTGVHAIQRQAGEGQ